MILHNVHYKKFDIKQDDTLEHPQHLDKRFEAIVANPPFRQNGQQTLYILMMIDLVSTES